MLKRLLIVVAVLGLFALWTQPAIAQFKNLPASSTVIFDDDDDDEEERDENDAVGVDEDEDDDPVGVDDDEGDDPIGVDDFGVESAGGTASPSPTATSTATDDDDKKLPTVGSNAKDMAFTASWLIWIGLALTVVSLHLRLRRLSR